MLWEDLYHNTRKFYIKSNNLILWGGHAVFSAVTLNRVHCRLFTVVLLSLIHVLRPCSLNAYHKCQWRGCQYCFPSILVIMGSSYWRLQMIGPSSFQLLPGCLECLDEILSFLLTGRFRDMSDLLISHFTPSVALYTSVQNVISQNFFLFSTATMLHYSTVPQIKILFHSGQTHGACCDYLIIVNYSCVYLPFHVNMAAVKKFY